MPAVRPDDCSDNRCAQSCKPASQGHSKNPPCHRLDSLCTVFAEVFTGRADGLTAAADDPEGRVANAGQGAGPGTHAATVLVHRDVSNVVQFVFNAPMSAVELQQTLWRRLGGRQACDQVDRLGRDFAPDLTGALEPRNLGKTRPIEMQHGFTADRDPARLDTAMLLADCLGAPEIRRRAVVDPVDVPGGNDRRRLRRYRLSGRVGCLSPRIDSVRFYPGFAGKSHAA
jgi:hypothetical protein